MGENDQVVDKKEGGAGMRDWLAEAEWAWRIC